jgi:SAM-dependent methyltransferase
MTYFYGVMTRAELDKLLAANRDLWNKRTEAHLASEFYDVKNFKDGKSSLNAYELELLGDVKGKSILHLQCHFGQDSLSLARMGAKVTGIDFTDTAIAAAQKLNEEMGLDAKFVCSDVYDTRQHVKEQFDVVFTSYGTIGWLPVLRPWAQVISESLKPGGKFVIVDFHPFVWMLDDRYESFEHSYFNHDVIATDTTGSYASQIDLHPPAKEYGWNHPFTDLLTTLVREGLILERFNEYDGSPYNCFPDMVRHEDGLYRFSKWDKKIPLVYAIRFRKP